MQVSKMAAWLEISTYALSWTWMDTLQMAPQWMMSMKMDKMAASFGWIDAWLWTYVHVNCSMVFDLCMHGFWWWMHVLWTIFRCMWTVGVLWTTAWSSTWCMLLLCQNSYVTIFRYMCDDGTLAYLYVYVMNCGHLWRYEFKFELLSI
jgi:hypothetical protein